MASAKRKVLVLVDWFEPGFKAGGPIRSAVNLVNNLRSVCDIHVLTTDRDLGAGAPYPGIHSDEWLDRDGFRILYSTPSLSWTRVLGYIREVDPDVLILNSMYSLYYSLYPVVMKRMGMIKCKVILAPRGMLKDSAISQKSAKKKLFLRIYKTLGLHKGLVFQATDKREYQDVIKWFGDSAEVENIPNFPASVGLFEAPPAKEPGSLSLIFVGRIHPIKKLDLLIRALSLQEAKIRLTVVAPVEDQDYWAVCRSLIEKLPENITVQHLEHVPHEAVRPLLLNNHIFALPTEGENFGHAIFEALAAGRPVLISDQTPWRNLEVHKAGWDVKIDDAGAFEEKIRIASAFDDQEMTDWCHSAWEFARNYGLNNTTLEKYIKLIS